MRSIVPGGEPVPALARELAAAAQRFGLDWTGQQVHRRLDEGGLGAGRGAAAGRSR